MTTLLNIISSFTLATLFSYNTLSTSITETAHIESILSDIASISIRPSDLSTSKNDEDVVDTTTTIKFNEFSISIHGLSINNEDRKFDSIQKDTVEIYAELGETIEGQLISISSSQHTKWKVEQRYETSVTIMNEGSHCDLTDWKHYYSNWKKLTANSKGQFICHKYTAKENRKFLKISIEDLKHKVKEQCGDEWHKLVEKVKKPTEYPSSVSISRYYLRVTGQRKDNGQSVTKWIILEAPMGC